ncbi:MAG: N-acetylneuraminate synthase [Eubacteriales bacterium]
MSTYIIAEAGVNHNGDISLAKKLIDVAALAKVDAVKFQTFRAETLVTLDAQKADYQKERTGSQESQYEMLQKLELSREDHIELMEYCEEKGVTFLSTPFDRESLQLLLELGIERIKIPSGEITNYPLLKEIAKTKLPIIISTGMCEYEEIDQALAILTREGNESISILHCNTQYPTPYEDVNLRVLEEYRTRYPYEIGYSDHTQGIEVPIAAVTLGATVIEKHFTLDKTMEGPDHKASLEPQELADMVRSIRNIEQAMGCCNKCVTPSEQGNVPIARKSIVAKKEICCGELFSEDNLAVKRPGDGISPMKWEEVIGQQANKAYKKDELIRL